MKRQRIYGLLLIICGLLTALPEHDLTAAVFLVPLGLYLLLTRSYVLYDKQKASAHGNDMDKRKAQRAVR